VNQEATYKDYSSEDLLIIISFGEEEIEERNSAFGEFVSRYRENLLNVCEKKCVNFGHDCGDAQIIVKNTFLRVLKYQSFDKSKAKTTNPDNAIFGWLMGILKTEFHKYYYLASTFDTYENTDIIYGAYQGDGYKFIENKKHLGIQNQSLISALKTLTEKERIVFLTYGEFSHDGDYLPRTVRQAMSDELGLASSSLRVYNARAKEKLKILLQNK
jgi:DNA-directed RNA polymerase specialized sigma24 family protein